LVINVGEPHLLLVDLYFLLKFKKSEIRKMQNILSIAASDSCAGAGLQADLKTISALGAYCLTVLTAVTAQNTRGVTAVQNIDRKVVYAQLEAIFSDIKVDAVKIGMLSGPSIVKAVAEYLSRESIYSRVPVVIDPVMIASSGDRLLDEEAITIMKDELFPLARIITPNLAEAETLLGIKITGINDMEMACRELLKTGSRWVVIKGGHIPGEPVEVVGNAEGIYRVEGKRIKTSNNHGTGCTFSSAIAVYLAEGYDELPAVKKAKDYVESALRNGFAIGAGAGILQHFV
jgi:hydroxymethylpyrimidine/phosphomethylpyrimidine kinase